MNAVLTRALAVLVLTSFVLASPAARATCSTNPADVAPGMLGAGLPTPLWTVVGDEVVDIQDVLALLNGAVGNYNIVWAPPVGASCPALPGNVSPGSQDDGFSPARWTPTPDGAIDVGDVLVALRLAVFLIELDPAWLTPILTDGEVGDRVVAGSVIDSVSASGLPAVVVTALVDDAPVGSTNTDADGKFLLQGLPSGTVTLSLDGSASTALGKFSSLEVQIEVDTTATTSVQPLTLPDESDPDGASGKFTGDETGTVDEEIALSSGDGDVGLATGPGGKIEIDGEPADMEVDLSVVPIEGEDLPEQVTDDQSGEGLNSTGEVAVGPAEGKFTGGGAGLSGAGVDAGFDLTLPNRHGLPIGELVDIWHWDGASWVNCTAATGRGGEVIDQGGGRTAVFAAGVATEGGLYAAAVPVDFFCTSSLSGVVLDQNDEPLAGVFVGTSLGASGFTDEFGNFFIQDIPAYSGVDLGDCVEMGYEVFVRGGVELGNATAGVIVDAFDIFLGFETWVGDIRLTVPNEGCLSGLVLSNDAGLSGPVTITGPENLVLMADALGGFFHPSLTPGSYQASFQFPGEPLPREFSFDIVARLCTTIRLAVNAGAGSSRLTVQAFYDDDDDFLTGSLPASGALIRVVGSDPVSASGLEALTGEDGLAVFDAVDPPYDIVAIIERPLDGDLFLSGTGMSDYPIMRIGTGLVTSAPLGVASLLLRLPLSVEDFGGGPVYDGDVFGTISNAPTPGMEEVLQVAPLRRHAYDGLFGGSVNPQDGSYFSAGFFAPFDLAVSLATTDFPSQIREFAFLGPFQLPLPMIEDDPVFLEQDLDYAMGDRLAFDQPLALSYVGFLTSANDKVAGLAGQRPDGRSFWALDSILGPTTPFPAMMNVPAPSSTDLSLALEFASESDVAGLGSQACIVPLRDPLPDPFADPAEFLPVVFSRPPEITSPPNGSDISIDQASTGPFGLETWNDLSEKGFEIVNFEQTFPNALAGEIGVTSFMRILSLTSDGARSLGSATIGPTPQPFVVPDVPLWVHVDSIRSENLPDSADEIFGPSMEMIFQSLPTQPHPTNVSSQAAGFGVLPLDP